MKIKALSLTNFKGFKQVSFDFDGKNILISGINGCGKSSVLEAITLILSKLASNYTPNKALLFSEEAIKNKTSQSSIKVELYYKDQVNSISLSKKRANKSRGTSPSVFIIKYAEHLLTDLIEIVNQEDGNIPIIVNYPTQRNVIDVPVRIKKRHKFEQVSSYDEAFHSGVSFRTFFEWYRNEEDLENERKLNDNLNFEDKKLFAVRTAIYSFLPGFSNLRMMRSRQKMVIEKNGETLSVNQLSDGEKCLLALIGDLARRLALANPKDDNPLNGLGIVIIDEIDLHLHPSMQRRVMENLSKTFPNIQFIITTHSPQVIGSADDFINFFLSKDLNDDEKIREIKATLFGKDSNLILEEYMETSSRDPEIQKVLDQLFTFLSKKDLESSRRLYNNLQNTLDSSEPLLVKADFLLKRMERMSEHEKNN